MSLSDLLSIGRSALLAHQRALAVTAQNVANANTPGYSRQILNLRSTASNRAGLGWVGQGVNADDVTRVRDRFLDAMYRRRAGIFTSADVLQEQLSQVESVLNEPSELGISTALDEFFRSFSELSNEPSSATNRQLVVAAASRMISQIRDVDGTIDDVAEQTGAQILSNVSEANDLLKQIAECNDRILSFGGSNGAPDLEDQRDQLIDRLAELIPVDARPEENGTITVTSGGHTLVQGDQAEQILATANESGGYALTLSSDGSTFRPDTGSLGALTKMLNETLPDMRSRLDAFVNSFVTEVNTIHRTGTTQTGRTGVDFFDAAGLTAGSMALSADVAGSASEIAAGLTADPGDNTIALQIADLAYRHLDSLGGVSLRDKYLQFSSSVAAATRAAKDDLAVQESLVVQAENSRQAVIGVSVDEEMVNLVAQQEAYAAAARLIQVSTELLDTILGL